MTSIIVNPRWKWAAIFGVLMAMIVVPFVIFEDDLLTAVDYVKDNQQSRLIFALFAFAALVGDVVLPVPSSIVATLAGSVLGFAVGTTVCWAGLTVGCLVGHTIGRVLGRPVVEQIVGAQELYKADQLVDRSGTMFLILSRAVPVLSEVSAIATGAAQYPLGKFFVVTALGNLGISAIYCFFGAAALAHGSFILVVGGAIGVPALVLGLFHLLRR